MDLTEKGDALPEKGTSMDDKLRRLLREIEQAHSSLALFLVVYRFLETSRLWNKAHRFKDQLQQLMLSAPLHDWRGKVLASVQSRLPWELPGYFTEAITSQSASGADIEFALKLLAGAKTIDGALAGVHIFGPPAVGDRVGFRHLRTQLRKGLPLCSHGGFGLFPSPRQAVLRARRGQLLQDHFDYLNVVPLAGDIPVTYAFNASSTGLSEPSLESVAILPVVVKADEVEWTLQGSGTYRVRLAPGHLAAIAGRLEDALEWVLARQPEVVVLPELVGDPRLDVMIKRYLSKRSTEGRFVPSLLLCGSVMHEEGDRIRNRARVISGDGGELWLQDKMHAYEFTLDEQRRTRWPLGEADPVSRMECIDIDDRKLTVFDLGPHVRCAVLICEDFKQANSLEALESWEVTLFLVPVMNGPLTAGDWSFERAVQLADRPGSTSIVANSATLMPPPASGKARDGRAQPLAHAIGSPRKEVFWTVYPDEPGVHPTAIFGALMPYIPPTS